MIRESRKDEEDVLGFGKTFWLGHLGACQFESAELLGMTAAPMGADEIERDIRGHGLYETKGKTLYASKAQPELALGVGRECR